MVDCLEPRLLFRGIFNELYDAVILYDVKNLRLQEINKRGLKLFACSECSELQAQIANCLDTGEPYTLEAFREYGIRAMHNEPQEFEWRIRNQEGEYLWVKVRMKLLSLAGQNFVLIVMNDVTSLKNVHRELTNSEARFQELAESLPQVVFEIDTKANLTFCNRACFDFFGVPREEFEKGIHVMDYLIPEDRERCRFNMIKLIQGQIPRGGTEYTLIKRDGTRIPVILHARPIIKDGVLKGFRGFITDITNLKENEQQLHYLSYHDSLTGLFNRYSFEERLNQLEGYSGSVLLILCDIDGLKIVNDTFGHWSGDERLCITSQILTCSISREAFVARIGGDEFAILFTDVDLSQHEECTRKINEAVEEYNRNPIGVQIPLSLSMGMAYSSNSTVNPWKLFSDADNKMNRQKLYHSQSTRSDIVHTLLRALKARDFITEGHADRLKNFVSALGRIMKLPESKVTDLCLLAHFHDIGKVGIPDRILFKKGKLTQEERMEMQRHSEIGFRIAQSSQDLMHIADLILKHHEWWDGTGYPLGLKGREIPLECRILAIADVFDAMINDRPYRKAMSLKEAINELEQGAGSQFDPELVDRFIALIPKPFGEQVS